MKKIFALLGLLFILTSAVRSQEINLDELLQKYFKAAAYDKLQKVNTIISYGTLVQQDLMPIKIVRMRPDKYLQEFDVADMTAYQAYDGSTAWMTAPWTGNPRPQPLPDDRLKDIKVKADFNGLLFHWKAKGEVVELAGTDTVDNTLAYKIKVTRKDGGIEHYSIDKKSFILLKRQYTRVVKGKEMKMDVVYRDYKEVDGIPFAFTLENRMGGETQNSIKFDSVVLNRPVNEKVFALPN